MITYEKVLGRLFAESDQEYAAFHKKLLKNDAVQVIGVRIPVLRRLAKEWKGQTEHFLSFPDEYYEITFLKCTLVGALPYDSFIEKLDSVVPLLDNWAVCDCFTAPCVKKHREEFLAYIQKYLKSDKEFTVRYALVMLLHYYVEDEYLPFIFDSVENVSLDAYYVMMGAAWLVAETLVKNYEEGLAFLKKNTLPKETHNTAIRKACESYRVSKEQKLQLKSLRR